MQRENNFAELIGLSKYKFYKGISSINMVLSQTQSLIRNIEDNADMPADEKRQSIDVLYREMINTPHTFAM